MITNLQKGIIIVKAKNHLPLPTHYEAKKIPFPQGGFFRVSPPPVEPIDSTNEVCVDKRRTDEAKGAWSKCCQLNILLIPTA